MTTKTRAVRLGVPHEAMSAMGAAVLSMRTALGRAAQRLRRDDDRGVIPASEATHERFAREEGPPAIMLTGAQTEQLREIELSASRETTTPVHDENTQTAAKA
jgi:hypothetical protein